MSKVARQPREEWVVGQAAHAHGAHLAAERVALHLAAEGLRDELVTEADAQHRPRAAAMPRTSSSVLSIHGARSVTLELEPVRTKASASRGPGSGALVRTSTAAHCPGQASPVFARIHAG